MLIIGERFRLAEIFEEYANQNNYKVCSFNFLAWLQDNGLLNIEACRNYLIAHKGELKLILED